MTLWIGLRQCHDGSETNQPGISSILLDLKLLALCLGSLALFFDEGQLRLQPFCSSCPCILCQGSQLLVLWQNDAQNQQQPTILRLFRPFMCLAHSCLHSNVAITSQDR